MPRRNVSFIGENTQQSNSIAAILPSKWSNYGLAIWSPTEPVMLRLELYESWMEKNFVWFKRVPRTTVAELQRRQVGYTDWCNEAIVVQGINIVAPGPPYGSTKRMHFLWADHQSFVEELAKVITKNPPPCDPPQLPIRRGPEALVTWDKGSPIAVTFQIGDHTISDDWMGGFGMLYAYPGGPTRHKWTLF